MRGVLLAGVLLLGACTGSGDPVTVTTTTTTTTAPVTTEAPPTTIETERCPDVFCVVYQIRDDARWSDGLPVGAADFVHTLAVAVDPLASDPQNPGYRLISGHQVIDPKTVLFSFSEPFGAWRTLFEVVLPAHGEVGRPSPTSGPFVVAEWIEGDRIVLERNPAHPLADRVGGVTEIRFTFPQGVRGMIGDLRRGEVDLVNPRPVDWAIDDIDAIDGVDREMVPGPLWEQVTFNLDDPLLSQRWVREAIALGIDREAVMDATVRSIDPAAEPLGSVFYMQGSEHYRNNYPSSYDPELAERILRDHGCERGDDGVHLCQGRRMSFIWATTAGEQWRESQVSMAVDTLGAIGVEIVPRLMVPSEMFARGFLFADSATWQLMSFSWRTPSDPLFAEPILRCEGDGVHGMGELNVGRFCHPESESLLDAAAAILDADQRALAYSTVDSLFLGELAVIPLYQKPALLAWSSVLDGPRVNPAGTDLWNVGEWQGADVVTVALGAHPGDVATLGPVDDAAAMVRDALYLGAFTLDPEWRILPELVVDAETFFRSR